MHRVMESPESKSYRWDQGSCDNPAQLGGSWVVISRATSRVTILITHIRGLITLLITTPEPPRKVLQ